MFKNYLKIAWRSLQKHKLFAAINIVGLAIGLSASFVIGAIIFYDFTFDKFHVDGDRIYRITSDFSSSDGVFYNPGVAVPLGTTLNENTPGLDVVAPIFTTYPLHIKNSSADKLFKNPKFVIYTDGSYFKLFNYKWLAGSQVSVLENPNEVVLTENRARKYFPNTELNEIIGKDLIYNDTIPVKLTGIVANFEERTDIVFEEFISLKTANQSDMTSSIKDSNWNNTNSASQLFIKLSKNTKLSNVQLVLNQLAVEHKDPDEAAFGQERTFHLQPLSDLHFNSNYYTFDFSEGQASKSVLINLAYIALFLLLLACINFINLNTAQATQRAKEIGIRKTLGSSKKQLIIQFLSETFLLTIFAALVSLFLSFWLLQVFSDFIPKGISFELFSDPLVITFMLLLLVVITILSGFYPALVLSQFKPIAVLKSQISHKGDNASLRKYLTVFQFVIAQIFIIATLLVSKQIHFLASKDMGFKTEAVASIRTPWESPEIEKRMLLTSKIKALPIIQAVSLSGNTPASFSTSSTNATFTNGDNEIRTPLQLLYGDQNYLKLYDIEILAGRNQLNDSISEYVINEAYMKKLGFENPQDALNKSVKTGDESHLIVGVMKDFNQRSLKTGIEPMAFLGANVSRFNTIHFSFLTKNSDKWSRSISQIESAWKSIYPDSEFKLTFMDETIKRFYKQEQKTSVLLNWATGLSILISCLGLLGLVIHTTQRRTKEIGIRKVLGASLTQLNFLLCKEFILLVIIAFAIAAPVAWYGLHNWLEGFTYKTSMSWWVFLISGFIMILVAILIMSIKTLSAANSNPVESLKTE
ncbi:ABC transporter permease [Aureibaculum luteum]|uniref:ABC transporter permease n=1 Tax=Aureibaculum luteum TaxID=1548456 RepID=UPI000E4CF63D|nr:FtsX-like permease family protein [Aureibaculum luteum]